MRSELSQGLVRSNVVVDVFPLKQSLVQGSDVRVAIIDLIELLSVGALSALDTAIELGASGR